MSVKVRKYWGNFPETINMLGENVTFDANGEAEVSSEVANFLATELSHEYAVADAEGNFASPASEEDETPKRAEVTEEERTARGELVRLRAELPELIGRLEAAEQAAAEANEANGKLAEENAALKAELETLKAAPVAPAADATPSAPAAPAPRRPQAPKADK